MIDIISVAFPKDMKNSKKTDENVSVPAEEAHCFHFMAPPNNDILISLLPDGTISAANEEFAKFVHRPSKEILQKNISTLVNAAQSKIIVHLLQQVQSPLSQATLFEESVFSDSLCLTDEKFKPQFISCFRYSAFSGSASLN